MNAAYTRKIELQSYPSLVLYERVSSKVNKTMKLDSYHAEKCLFIYVLLYVLKVLYVFVL